MLFGENKQKTDVENSLVTDEDMKEPRENI